jgi:hypothetical protein
VAGSYTGLVTSKEDGSVQGALQLDLRADTLPNDPKDGDTGTGSPILVTSVRFLDERPAVFTSTTTFYDPETNSYNTQVSVELSDIVGDNKKTKTETVSITGSLVPGHLSGEIATLSYPQSGGRFELVRSGEPIESLIRKERARRPRRPRIDNMSFVGTGRMSPDQQPRTVDLSVNRDNQTGMRDFFDIFAPDSEKALNATINFHEPSINFIDAIWDSGNGTLEGSTPIGGHGEATAYLRCWNFFFASSRESFHCQYWSTRSSVIDVTFKPPFHATR